MRKPVSKHALRRALTRVHKQGHIEWKEPEGAIVDRIWHELERQSYNGARKRPVMRETVRTIPTAEISEPDSGPEV
jgi:DNA-binding FadR family transcriptional regulator